MSAGATADASAVTGEEARVRRVPVIDEYVEDGRSAILLPGQVLTLSEVATAVLALMGLEWSSVADLVVAVETEIGAPDGISTHEALGSVLDDLAGHGLVELEAR